MHHSFKARSSWCSWFLAWNSENPPRPANGSKPTRLCLILSCIGDPPLTLFNPSLARLDMILRGCWRWILLLLGSSWSGFRKTFPSHFSCKAPCKPSSSNKSSGLTLDSSYLVFKLSIPSMSSLDSPIPFWISVPSKVLESGLSLWIIWVSSTSDG